MNLYEDEGGYVFELSESETDRFYEPFNGSDPTMTFKQYLTKQRWLKADIEEWLYRMVGQRGDFWVDTPIDGIGEQMEIWFMEKRHAMAFKLVYGCCPA
jgi:hypothetical protein